MISINKIRAAVSRTLEPLVRWTHPGLFLDRDDLFRAAREIGSKLREARDDAARWRKRAMSAEQAIRDMKTAQRDAVARHDRDEGTCLSW